MLPFLFKHSWGCIVLAVLLSAFSPNGVEGMDELGLRIGVIEPSGVQVLGGSLLVIGVITVPTSLVEIGCTLGVAKLEKILQLIRIKDYVIAPGLCII
jgi:hypothetical protein